MKTDVTMELESKLVDGKREIFHDNEKIGSLDESILKISHKDYELETKEVAFPLETTPEDLTEEEKKDFKPKMVNILQCTVYRIS